MADLLLVDNDRRIVELLGFFLTKRGHAVRTVDSFRAARAAILERAPELMLSDLDLGAERGDEELPRLAREGLLPPTLVVSGFLDARIERELGALPRVIGTLRKPFDLAVLEKTVQESLARARTLAPPAAPGAPFAPGIRAPQAPSASASPAAGLAPSSVRNTASNVDDDAGWVDVKPFEGGA